MTTGVSIPAAARSITLRRLALAAALTLTALVASAVRGQEKTTPLSKVERLNRAPVRKEVLRVRLPRPTVTKLPDGLTLLLLDNHKLPTVALTVCMRQGQLTDPSDLPGLASFPADMLREGTERRSSVAIAAEADSLGAT